MPLEYKSKLETKYLSHIADFAEKTIRALGCQNQTEISDILWAIDEAATNIIQHGKKTHKKNYFTILISKIQNLIEIQIIDYGKPYAFDQLTLPSQDLPFEERVKHGFGVGFIKAIMDHSEYQTLPEKNILRLQKKISTEKK